MRSGNDGKAARLRNQSFPQGRAGFAVRGTISGETVAARSPQSLYFRGGNTVTPDQRETDPDCAASVRLGQLRPTTLTLQEIQHMTSDRDTKLTPETILAELTQMVWKIRGGHTDRCPPEQIPTFSQLDDVITATAWAADARLEFNQRWSAVKELSQSKFDAVDSFALLTHMAWSDVTKTSPRKVLHPLAPLIHAWHSRPVEVSAVRDANGDLRPDTIVPRLAMRGNGSKTDRLYLIPAHICADGDSQLPLLGLADPRAASRMPVLPVHLYDLGVRAGEQKGGGRGAPIPARMLVKLAAAPSTSVRHGERFVTYDVTLRDLRDALYPPERLDGRQRQPPPVSRLWPRVREGHPNHQPATPASRYSIQRQAQAAITTCCASTENFGKITLDTPINVVLDIPPEVEGGVQLPVRLDQWGAESAPAYRALIGLSFLWHEPGRTHAPKNGRWMRKTGPDPYDPLTDDDAVALAFPSNITANPSQLRRRAWGALENLEEHGELRIDERRILPPTLQSASKTCHRDCATWRGGLAT